MKYGDEVLPSRYWDKVYEVGDCWLWGAYATPDGYGRFKWNGRLMSAHRVMMSQLGLDIDGFQIDHICDNTLCVNPMHLDVVNNNENQRRKAWRRTHCKRGHAFTIENTRLWNNRKQCIACKRAYDKKKWKK